MVKVIRTAGADDWPSQLSGCWKASEEAVLASSGINGSRYTGRSAGLAIGLTSLSLPALPELNHRTANWIITWPRNWTHHGQTPQVTVPVNAPVTV